MAHLSIELSSVQEWSSSGIRDRVRLSVAFNLKLLWEKTTRSGSRNTT